MRTPAHRAHASLRVALAYRLDPLVATRALPAGLRAKTIHGRALGVVLVTRFDRVRPRALPVSIGMSVTTCAHTVLADWESGDHRRSGLCVLRRDLDARWLGPAGGLVLPGSLHGARFSLERTPEQLELRVMSLDSSLELELRGAPAPGWPAGSLFTSWREAAEFCGVLGGNFVSPRPPGRLDHYALDSQGGAPSALAVQHLHDSWFEGSELFPAGCAEFDSALLVQDVACLWRARPAAERSYGRRTRILSPTEISPA